MNAKHVRLEQTFNELLADSHRNELPSSTPRRLRPPVRVAGKATAVVGMRRVGKTTVMHQLRRERIREGIPQERLPYISFADERLAEMEASDFDLLLTAYDRSVPELDDATPVGWHMDDVQFVPGWEGFVRRLLDSGGTEVVVTGSSDAILSRATDLCGRVCRVALHPFSFDEALRHQGRAVPDDAAALRGAKRKELRNEFHWWLMRGGFPEVQGLDRPWPEPAVRLLTDTVDLAILRDVIECHAVGNVKALRRLMRHLLVSTGGAFSIEGIHAGMQAQGIRVSRDTLHRFLGYLVDCFLVRIVSMESKSERQRMVNLRKAYPIDSGLVSVFDRTAPHHVSRSLRTAVLAELERRGLEVTYVGTPHGDVNFLARRDSGEAELIHCPEDGGDATAACEYRALAWAGDEFPDVPRRLLVRHRGRERGDLPPGVKVQWAGEWLLQGAR